MTDSIVSKGTIIGVLGAVLGATGVWTYLVSRRSLSASGARLLADLEIYGKAKQLQIGGDTMKAIEKRLWLSAWRHAGRPVELPDCPDEIFETVASQRTAG